MDAKLAQFEKAAEQREAGEEACPGLETPWPAVTELMAGLEVGLTILAGRPSQGKTTIEDQIVVGLAARGVPVGRITLDSTPEELMARAMCRMAGVSLPKLKFGWAGRSNLARVRQARDILAQYPMYITDQEREIRGICARARAWRIHHGIELLTVDFVQLVEAADMGRSQWDRVACVSYVSKTLKALAFQLKIPVLVLSQLSRAVEKDGREPVLSDLRDSGSLEQDAEKVAFVYKDRSKCRAMEAEAPGITKKIRATWLDVLKHKNGQTDRQALWMRPHYFRFDEDPSGDFSHIPGIDADHDDNDGDTAPVEEKTDELAFMDVS
jgi:replicative DNA helicase